MNAKKSFFNKKIFTNNLIQALPIILMMTAFLLLYTISAINGELNLFEYENFSAEEKLFRIQHSIYNYASTIFFKFVLTCYSFICGIFVFRYFYNKKLCATIHALPLTRDCMYITNLLSGLVILVLPILFTSGVLAGYLGFLGYSASHIPLWMLIMSGYCLIFYAMAVLTAMLTGLLTATPVVYFLFNFGIIIAQYIFAIFTSNFYFGIEPYDMSVKHLILTPFAYFYSKLHALDYAIDTVGFEKEGINGIIIYAIVSVIFFVIGFFLYRIRHLETQGDPIVTKRLQPFFHYAGTVLGASALTLILFAIFFTDYEGYYVTRTGLMTIVVLFILCSILFYYVIRMLLRKTFKVFKNSVKGIVIYSVVALVAIFLISIDVFGVQTAIPELKDIEHVSVYFDSFDKDCETKEQIEQLHNIHQTIINEKDAIIEELEKYPKEATTSYFDITYTLNDGSTMTRSYTLGYQVGDESTPYEIVNTITELLSNKESMLQEAEIFKTSDPYIYIFNTAYESITSQDIFLNEVVTIYGNEGLELTEQNLDAFYEALEKDIEAGTVKYEIGCNDDTDGFRIDIGCDYKPSNSIYLNRYYVVTEECENLYPYIFKLFKEDHEKYPEYIEE